MNINLSINLEPIHKLIRWFDKKVSMVYLVTGISIILSSIAICYFYFKDYILLYGDAESHINIAKRVIDSITPGAAQLGGIWLPLPHLLLVPFVHFDFLWRTGLAGAIVSGAAYIISSVFLYKTTFELTKNKLISFVSFLIFALNPNILYMQATPMTELVLIMFFILSSYYYILFLQQQKNNVLMLILAAFFGFCASLSRYDGWFLVLFEAFGIFIFYGRQKKTWRELEGKLIMFSTLAFFGVALWMMWDLVILGDPFYFTNSQFSAKTQQLNWLSKGELPAYHNIFVSIAYYFVTAMSNSGFLIFIVALVGFVLYLRNNFNIKSLLITMILLVPFIFNVTTLFLGQSVIFIPHLTPSTFEWRLFNVRYGIMMVPVVSFFIAYLFWKVKTPGKLVIIFLCLVQLGLFAIGFSPIISLEDGRSGLSMAKRPDAEKWMKHEYDGGLVLIDDYARSVSIVRSGIPMQNIIYIGNQKYWDESFYAPEKYARWIIMQKDDDVWKGIYAKPHMQARLFKYFNKVYTSPDTLIFRRIDDSKVK